MMTMNLLRFQTPGTQSREHRTMQIDFDSMVALHMPLEFLDNLSELWALDREDLTAFFTADMKEIIGASFHVFVARSRIAAVIKAPHDPFVYQFRQAAVKGCATQRFALLGKMQFNVFDRGPMAFVFFEVRDQDGRLARLIRLPVRHESTAK